MSPLSPHEPNPASGRFSLEFVAAIEAALRAGPHDDRGRELVFSHGTDDHPDLNPSARWNRDKLVFTCDVCRSGGGLLDLARLKGVPFPSREPDGVTVAQLAEYLRLPEDFLREWGVTDGRADGHPAVVIPYVDEHGLELAVQRRLHLRTTPKFKFRSGDHPPLYGLDRLSIARAFKQILIVEGPSDAWACWHAGIGAIGVASASLWKSEYASLLGGFDHIAIWHEPDAGGDSLVHRVLADLPDLRVIEAPAGSKDPSDLWRVCGADIDLFRSKMRELATTARPASELRAEALSAEARALFEQCRYLLDDPDLFARIGEAMQAGGYVGELKAPLSVYVTLTSRLTERPRNEAVIAQSASGKSYAVDTATRLMPESAYYQISASSPLVLAYTAETFEHKIIIYAEADSIPEDGPAASMVRSIITDAEARYEVTVKGEDGLFTTQRISKPGPSGLITTSTRPLPHQFSTRMLATTVDDSPQQVKRVLHSLAAAANGALRVEDPLDLLALQRWLEIAGDREVTIPYAHFLADNVPHVEPRANRDFRQLLVTIETVAILHQRQRGRDERGRIVAEPKDYELARWLLLDSYTSASHGGLTAPIREAVTALVELHETTGTSQNYRQVGDKLNVPKNTAKYRLDRAIQLGYVVNNEDRPGRPAKLVPGEPLPDARPALPLVDDIPAHPPELNCTVEPRAGGERDTNLGDRHGAVQRFKADQANQADHNRADEAPAGDRDAPELGFAATLECGGCSRSLPANRRPLVCLNCGWMPAVEGAVL